MTVSGFTDNSRNAWLRLTFAVLAAATFLSLPTRADEKKDIPENCFLFAYFYTTGESGLHLAWSRDGLSFEPLNGGASYLKPEVGESKLIRDPGLMRGPDGIFRLVWTTSWAGKTIGYAESKDLIHWSPQRA